MCRGNKLLNYLKENFKFQKYITLKYFIILSKLYFYKTKIKECGLKLREDKVFKVNEYITLRLENNNIRIYVKDKPINLRNRLLIYPVLGILPENIKSIDQIEENYKTSPILPGFNPFIINSVPITKAEEFWGICSNLQFWAEQNYNTLYLHRNIAFPLLKKLTEEGDNRAKEVFKEEVFKRYISGTISVKKFLKYGGYMKLLLFEHYKELQERLDTPLLELLREFDLVDKFLNNLNQEEIESVIKTRLNNINLTEILKFISDIGFQDLITKIANQIGNNFLFKIILDLKDTGKILQYTNILEDLSKQMPDLEFFRRGMEWNFRGEKIYINIDELYYDIFEYFHELFKWIEKGYYSFDDKSLLLRVLDFLDLIFFIMSPLPEVAIDGYEYNCDKFGAPFIYEEFDTILKDIYKGTYIKIKNNKLTVELDIINTEVREYTFNLNVEKIIEDKFFMYERFKDYFKKYYDSDYFFRLFNKYKIFHVESNNLNLRDSNIKSISEIKELDCLDELNHLDLSRNYISEIKGLENLRSLEYLDLSNNKITEINGLENLANLKILKLTNNEISEIKGLDNSKYLEYLDFSHNKIKEIKGLENLKNLKILKLITNEILEIKNIKNLRELETLELTNNKILEIEGLENFKVLDYLDLSNNEIIEVNGLENLTKLKILNLVNNQISDIKGFENLTSLEYLDLSGNKISEIKGLEGLVNLKELDLEYNEITEFKGLESHHLLKKLKLNNNRISDFCSLEHLDKLEYLDLSNNNIRKIKVNNSLINLRKIILIDNQIISIEGLENLDKIEDIYFAGNPLFQKLTNVKHPMSRNIYVSWTMDRDDRDIINELKKKYLKNLHLFSLQENNDSYYNVRDKQIKELALKITIPAYIEPILKLVLQLKNIEKLSIKANLRFIPSIIGNFKFLKELDLHLNELVDIPDFFPNLLSLETLDLSNNRLEALPGPICKLKYLKNLDLAYNKIQRLPEKFSDLKSLETLDLSYNILKELSMSILKLTSLKSLVLRDNYISKIPKLIGELKLLELIDLRDNNLSEIPDSIKSLKDNGVRVLI